MTYQRTVDAAPASQSLPRVRTIAPRDLVEVLAKGIDDFVAMPTHAIFISLIYPIAGLVIAGATFGFNLLPADLPIGHWFRARRSDCGRRPL